MKTKNQEANKQVNMSGMGSNNVPVPATRQSGGEAITVMPSLAPKYANPTNSPFYVAPENMTPLQKHCAFFDRDGDGVLMPWETFYGFRILGYGLFLSILGTAVVHVFFSWWTQDSWVPDPFFAILIKNVDRLKHGSDSQVYHHSGQLNAPSVNNVVSLLGVYDVGGKGGLSASDTWKMTQRQWDVMDFFGWWAGKLEWFFLWILAEKKGILSWDDVYAQYDGSLFEKIEAENRNKYKQQHQDIQHNIQ